MSGIINKWAMGLAVFSFGFLSVGSFLFGATATTSFLRGLAGGFLFGMLLWLVGSLFDEEKDTIEDDLGDEVDADQDLDTFDPDQQGVQEKFLKKSAEISEKDIEEEKEEKLKQETTPF